MSKKQPIGVLFADPHLHKGNIEQVTSLFKQADDLAVELDIRMYIMGDVFESRKAQPLDVLNAFGDILRATKSEKIAIPGNHDKVDYESEDSYLDEFQHHPNFILVKDVLHVMHAPICIHLIPYFKEETTYAKYLDKILTKVKKKPALIEKHILLTHIGVKGVKNNDGTEVENDLTRDKFKPFHKVFVGHYHNQSQVGKNIYYIGSTAPKNFGEDNEKGITLLFDDGSHEFIQLEFKEYYTIKIDIDKTSDDKIDNLLTKWQDSEDNIRFQFFGSKSKLDVLNVNRFKAKGIDVKLKRPDVDEGIVSAQKQEFIAFNKTSIQKEFDKFCKHNKLKDIKLGKKYLEKVLN